MAAKNQVQFQRGLSLMAFLDRYGSEQQCREALAKARWPKGWRCQGCGYPGHCHLQGRDVYQCNRCKRQVSLTSGTLFAETKLPLRTWFLAIYLLTQHKNGISALALRRQLGVSYNTAWLLKHKLMQAMVERDSEQVLGGIVMMDDAYWGGERHGGGTGRGSPGKTPFVAAVQCTAEGHPLAMRMDEVAGLTNLRLLKSASQKGVGRVGPTPPGAGHGGRHRRAEVLSGRDRCRLHAYRHPHRRRRP